MIKEYDCALKKSHDFVPVDGSTSRLVPGVLVRSTLIFEHSVGIVISVTDAGVTVEWAQSTFNFNKFIHRINKTPTGLSPQKITKFQPLSLPSAGIFYLDYTYGAPTPVTSGSG